MYKGYYNSGYNYYLSKDYIKAKNNFLAAISLKKDTVLDDDYMNMHQHLSDIYSNENVPLRIHRPSNANLDSSGAWGIGFSTRGDAITSTTDTRAGIFSYYNGNLFLAAANTSIVADPDAYARLTILNSGSCLFSKDVNNILYQAQYKKTVFR